MKEKTVKQLQKISQSRTFSKDEYICYEGEPGNEMYIVLKGQIGVYITNIMGTLVEVATMKAGDFFGEMAIFDKLPRSASCIALEDSICVAINRDNLLDFICQCPDMAEKILENMSKRIRKLDLELYKNTRQAMPEKARKFEIPQEYGFSHVVKKPYQEARYFAEDEQKCPVCGSMFKTINMKRHLMQVRNVDLDGRIHYLLCEPLWHEINTCPSCCYSNYRLNFFDINENDAKNIKRILREEHIPVIEDIVEKRTDYDNVVLHYLQAIHINESINSEDHLLIGTLWLYLYWLGLDSGDDKFTVFCVDNAIVHLQIAVDSNQIKDIPSRYSVALSLGNLFAYKQMDQQAIDYVTIALESPDDTIRNCAEAFMKTVSK